MSLQTEDSSFLLCFYSSPCILMFYCSFITAYYTVITHLYCCSGGSPPSLGSWYLQCSSSVERAHGVTSPGV